MLGTNLARAAGTPHTAGEVMAWSKKSVKVTALELDALNPRIPSANGTVETRDLIAALVSREGVYELAKSIADFGGLYPNESLIAVEEGGRKVVVEGNRRLAALKLLHSPDSAPSKDIARFSTLRNRTDLTSIEKVEVVFAPSRSVAAQIIVARHTGSSAKPWSRVQQAAYIHTLVGSNTIAEVSRAYFVTRS